MRKALYAIPELFGTELNISGILMADLFSLNSALGASIEQSVVESLNRLREVWDPGNAYTSYRWVRHSQAFPDVRLEAEDPALPQADRILMGIELKGWFVLSKEGEPSFRYLTTPGACAPADLVAVFPWFLSQVISGKPRLMTPWIEEANYAALLRNYYWETSARGGGPRPVNPPPGASPYPASKKSTNDRPEGDNGGNFGRIARSGIMGEFVEKANDELLAGVPVRAWLDFARAARDPFDRARVSAFAASLRRELAERGAELSSGEIEHFVRALVDRVESEG